MSGENQAQTSYRLQNKAGDPGNVFLLVERLSPPPFLKLVQSKQAVSIGRDTLVAAAGRGRCFCFCQKKMQIDHRCHRTDPKALIYS